MALLALAPIAAHAAIEAPAVPPANVTLQVDASSEDAMTWRVTVRNEGAIPVRLDADARLLTLEIQPVEGAATTEAKPATKGKASDRKAKGPPEPIVCKLPSPLRPLAFLDDRALILEPNARYDEVVNPALYCFDGRAARALTAGATVVAKLGFPAPAARGAKKAPFEPPFVVEPAARDASVSAIKELTAAPLVLSRDVASPDSTKSGDTDSGLDERAPQLVLSAPSRIDADNELMVGIPFTVKNVGARGTTVHIRRDNFLFDVDGPDGAAHCGYASNARLVPQELFSVMRTGGSQSLEVWVGEMCPDLVFDRPGLYRIWPTLAFPNSASAAAVQNWSAPLRTGEPILVRILRGRLPFYAEPPRAIRAR
jgi:hypothetical protein